MVLNLIYNTIFYLAVYTVPVFGILIAFAMVLYQLGKLTNNRHVMFGAGLLASVGVLIISAYFGMCISVVMRLLGDPGLAQFYVARFCLALSQPILGITFNVKNEERMKNRRGVIFISNHQTAWDVVMLGRMFQEYTSQTAKGSLKYYPFLGWFMWLSNTIFFVRPKKSAGTAGTPNRNNMSALDGAAEQIVEKQQNVWMFPEGTRSNFAEPRVLPFKKGAFILAIKAKVPIVPVVVGNYAHVVHVKSLRFQPGVIDVQVLEEIDVTGLTVEDAERVAKETEAKMAAVLKSLDEDRRRREILLNGTATDTTGKNKLHAA